MRGMKLALALGAATIWVGAVQAKPPTVFVQCDGYTKPKPGSNNLVKGKALTQGWGFASLGGSFNPRGRQAGAAGVAACKAALADPLAAEAGWIRRVTLKQALALHHLEAREPEAALAALDAAAAAAGPNASDIFYRRSTGVSLDILRSIALMRVGRTEEGLASVRRAADARPWSGRVQMLALALYAIDPAIDPIETMLADRLRSLDPTGARFAADVYLRGGRYADAWKILEASYRGAIEAEAAKTGIAKALAGATIRYNFTDDAVAAFAAARAGKADTARTILDSAAAAAKAQGARLAQFRRETTPAQIEQHERSLVEPVEQWRPLVAAASQLAAGETFGLSRIKS